MESETLIQVRAVLAEALAAVLQPFLAFNNGQSDLYWPYLLSTLALAVLAFAFYRREPGSGFLRGFAREFLSARVWWHASAKADYRYYVVNHIVFTALFAPLLLSGAWLAVEVQSGLAALAGGRVVLPSSGPGPKLAHTLVFFLCYDFGRYLAHYWLHQVPALWEFHKVHHSAEVLTPITNARAHPVELLVLAWVSTTLTGVATGLFMYLYAADVGVHTYLGLHVVVFVFSLYGNLRHTNVWLSFGPVLSHVFVSPAQHQIHHSVEPRHWARNLGFVLALWDWLFGTLYVPRGHEQFKMGLGDDTDPLYHGVIAMYWRPFKTLFARRDDP